MSTKRKGSKVTTDDDLRIEYMPLQRLLKFPGNPKEHNDDGIAGSVERFGFNDPLAIDERSGFLSEGHGRLHTLKRMRAAGDGPPEHIREAPDGNDWLVPVVRGASFKSKGELERYIVAHNQTTIGGGWGDGKLLAGILARADKAQVPVAALGFDAAQAKRIMVKAHARIPATGQKAGPELGGLKFRLVVDCRDEAHQGELLARLEREGLKCQPLMS